MPTSIRQGTILEFNSSQIFSYGVVITADCDIVQNKYGDRLAYVPIISHEEYIYNHWRFEQSEKEISKIYNYILEKGVYDLSKEDVVHLMSDLGVDLFVERLRNLLAVECDAARFSKYKALIESKDYSNLMIAYFGNAARVARGVKEILESLRSEYFILPHSDRLPYICGIVSLRNLQSVKYSDVDSNRKSSDGLMIRSVDCLPDRIRYSISQCFGYLYARIGLDSSFEADRKASIMLVSEEINA